MIDRPDDHFDRVARVFGAGAQDYVNAFMDLTAYDQGLLAFLNGLPANARVLDVGCGPGNISRYLLEHSPELRIKGIDIAEGMLEQARMLCRGAHFEHMDVRDLSLWKNERFDAAVCGFILPYLHPLEAEQLIADLSRLVHQGGKVYLSTMEEAPTQSGLKASSNGKYEPLHQNFYLADMLSSMLTVNGFTITHTSRVVQPDKNGIPATDLVLVAQLT
ncbi:MAG: class I SAM-dependent methyltransferase [Flavobacteriales bacterium]|nr:class I SAM-dependent methyltransferase [Flavobacteriales bacterium]